MYISLLYVIKNIIIVIWTIKVFKIPFANDSAMAFLPVIRHDYGEVRRKHNEVL